MLKLTTDPDPHNPLALSFGDEEIADHVGGYPETQPKPKATFQGQPLEAIYPGHQPIPGPGGKNKNSLRSRLLDWLSVPLLWLDPGDLGEPYDPVHGC